ncbi:hypothetical protein [Kaistia sp. MMO-174]|uniref:hypothetical protein n=1 Tax=Kaistia sp. MMO-174 TaxID=3081256 RepID=UPI0030191355
MNLFHRSADINSHGNIRSIRTWEADIREGRMAIGPDLAASILKEANYSGQRKVEQRDVGVYAEMMRRGLWELSDPITFAKLNGNLTLVNGQHRLQAVIAFGREVEFRVAVNLCSTPEEVRALYYRFDTVMRVRSNQQILNAIDLAATHGVSKGIAAATYGAIGVIANGFTVPNNYTVKTEAVAKLRIVDLRVEACEPWWPAARRIEEALKGAQTDLKPRILRGSTFAVALMTMRYQEAKAFDFWRGTARNDGLKRNDPRHVFVRDLTARDVSSGAHGQGVVAAALAWNAWFEGRSLSIIKVPQNHVLRIAGTPVNGRKG